MKNSNELQGQKPSVVTGMRNYEEFKRATRLEAKRSDRYEKL